MDETIGNVINAATEVVASITQRGVMTIGGLNTHRMTKEEYNTLKSSAQKLKDSKVDDLNIATFVKEIEGRLDDFDKTVKSFELNRFASVSTCQRLRVTLDKLEKENKETLKRLTHHAQTLRAEAEAAQVKAAEASAEAEAAASDKIESTRYNPEKALELSALENNRKREAENQRRVAATNFVEAGRLDSVIANKARDVAAARKQLTTESAQVDLFQSIIAALWVEVEPPSNQGDVFTDHVHTAIVKLLGARGANLLAEAIAVPAAKVHKRISKLIAALASVDHKGSPHLRALRDINNVLAAMGRWCRNSSIAHHNALIQVVDNICLDFKLWTLRPADSYRMAARDAIVAAAPRDLTEWSAKGWSTIPEKLSPHTDSAAPTQSSIDKLENETRSWAKFSDWTYLIWEEVTVFFKKLFLAISEQTARATALARKLAGISSTAISEKCTKVKSTVEGVTPHLTTDDLVRSRDNVAAWAHKGVSAIKGWTRARNDAQSDSSTGVPTEESKPVQPVMRGRGSISTVASSTDVSLSSTPEKQTAFQEGPLASQGQHKDTIEASGKSDRTEQTLPPLTLLPPLPEDTSSEDGDVTPRAGPSNTNKGKGVAWDGTGSSEVLRPPPDHLIDPVGADPWSGKIPEQGQVVKFTLQQSGPPPPPPPPKSNTIRFKVKKQGSTLEDVLRERRGS
jgi:hypothetical protein